MSGGFGLRGYLARIGFDGALRPDLATLSGLHAAHVAAIPFEGMDPLLGRPVRLDLESVQAKLIGGRRGGYCFEQNTVFKAALEAIGFRVTGLGGRVRWMAAPDSPLGPRTHMLLKVDLAEGAYLADVGFGACVMDAPLLLSTDVDQRSDMGTFRLSEDGGLFRLSALQPEGWRVMYVFDLVPQIAADYELGNWFTSTNPAAPFPNMLLMERVAGGRRCKLANRRFSVEARDGVVVSELVLNSAEALMTVLEGEFGVVPPVPGKVLLGRLGD
jgi:N-hydroxyarylamine O-acetyltransferase